MVDGDRNDGKWTEFERLAGDKRVGTLQTLNNSKAFRINNSIGSLGGGNHFIELDKDDDGNVYLVIHTGSRNLGKQVADIYQNRAIKHMTEGADEFEGTITAS